MPFKHSRVLWIGAALSVAVFAAPTGVTPDTRLLDAVASGDQAAVRSLLKRHADVNGAQADGTTALHLAARQGDVETARRQSREPVTA
jgi:ankyrin repeat protein